MGAFLPQRLGRPDNALVTVGSVFDDGKFFQGTSLPGSGWIPNGPLGSMTVVSNTQHACGKRIANFAAIQSGYPSGPKEWESIACVPMAERSGRGLELPLQLRKW